MSSSGRISTDGPGVQRYVLLPREGIRANTGAAFDALVSLPIVQSDGLPRSVAFDSAAGRTVTVIDTTSENGPKLVELDDAAAAAVNQAGSALRAVPVVEYQQPDPRPRPQGGATIALADQLTTLTVSCSDAVSGAAVSGVHVVAFTNFAQRRGDEGMSDASGHVSLQVAANTIERLYAYAPAGHWGAFRSTFSAAAPLALALDPVDLTYVDCVRYYYGGSHFNPATGVTVGVIDTGVGPHGDINLVGGRNTVIGESAADFADGDHHGTHVSGLIGAKGVPPAGLRGVAPGVPIRAYRVFPHGGAGATNYSILKAMIFAAADGCDIINLSLGGGPYDEIVFDAIRDARTQGMLVVVAAGNDGRGPVSYPAAYQGATAVSAMGREGTFPAGSVDVADILRPPSSTTDPAEFLAAFSNIGPQIAATGPGVGALSTLPGGGYGPLSGTSMAAPVVAGTVACLLSRDSVVYGMARTTSRADAIEKLLQTNCAKRGFGTIFEGYGLPDPAAV